MTNGEGFAESSVMRTQIRHQSAKSSYSSMQKNRYNRQWTKIIETKRLLLERINSEHAEQMFDGLSNEKLFEYLPENAPPSLNALQDRYRMLASGADPDSGEIWLNWILFRQETRQAIGYTQVTLRNKKPALIAYLIFQPHWCSGFASEALSATIEHIFSNYDASSIEAFIDTRNVASQNLILKLGFRYLEKIEQADFFKGKSSDEYRYCLMRNN